MGYQRHKHRCMNCEFCRYDRSLEYYPVYRCKADRNHSITLGITGGIDRPAWCPVYGPEQDEEEMESA